MGASNFAGKTFTMQGGADDQAGKPYCWRVLLVTRKTKQNFVWAAGVIPRAIHWIFAKMRFMSDRLGVACGSENLSLQLSCMEIYNESVCDLIQPKDQDLPIREDASRNIFIPNLAQVTFAACLKIPVPHAPN